MLYKKKRKDNDLSTNTSKTNLCEGNRLVDLKFLDEKLGPEYFEAGENRVEIFPRGGFYMPSNIWNLICLTHAPEYSNWKSFVRDVLIQVYENKLPNYTAKGKRSRPSIDGKLLKALFKKINEPRSCQEQVPEHVFIHFINHSIVNKRNYEENKNMDDNKAAKKLKKSTTEPKKAPNTKKNTVD
ncbi:hypothetical protein PV328_012045 [Microctonus aethiopoides]|uniref:Uncharacterized protein n=1 Tax=Microctonus aethiopoides TaxID=144406 RepID=A0AA39FHD5_9HYME|nr:hypothetical protein PV328_012045 [Microctonus aethiopoides]